MKLLVVIFSVLLGSQAFAMPDLKTCKQDTKYWAQMLPGIQAYADQSAKHFKEGLTSSLESIHADVLLSAAKFCAASDLKSGDCKLQLNLRERTTDLLAATKSGADYTNAVTYMVQAQSAYMACRYSDTIGKPLIEE